MRDFFGPAKLRDERCPYGGPPDIERDGDAWTINGHKPDLSNQDECAWLFADQNACEDCLLNPANRDLKEPSAFLVYLLELENTMAAEIPLGGFVFSPLDRRAIIMLKIERQKAESRRFNVKARGQNIAADR